MTCFDSTSPLRQAFKDDRDNYYAPDCKYTAIRIPQVEGTPSLQRRSPPAQVSQDEARRLEQASLEAMQALRGGRRTVDQVVEVLLEYERFYDPDSKKDHAAAYEKTLRRAPWRRCPCEVCQSARSTTSSSSAGPSATGGAASTTSGRSTVNCSGSGWTRARGLRESRQPAHRLKAQARG